MLRYWKRVGVRIVYISSDKRNYCSFCRLLVLERASFLTFTKFCVANKGNDLFGVLVDVQYVVDF